MVDEKKIDDLVTAAVMADLEGLEFLTEFDFATLRREYNGIGPEWAGATLRAKVTQYLALFEPAALIHDMRVSQSDGTRRGFNYANMEFLENCLKLADAKYPWYSWRRWRARAVAHVLYDCVRSDGGWKAWMDARESVKCKM